MEIGTISCERSTICTVEGLVAKGTLMVMSYLARSRIVDVVEDVLV